MAYKDENKAREYSREFKARKIAFHHALVQRYKLFVGCKLCGYKEHPAALEFAHREPRNGKGRTVGSLAGHPHTQALKAEIRKCDVLCSNCHSIQHYGESSNSRTAAFEAVNLGATPSSPSIPVWANGKSTRC